MERNAITMTFAAEPFAAVVNHLLAREAWARDKLAPYAGKTARLGWAGVSLMLRVQSDGYLAAVDNPDAKPDRSDTEAKDVDVALSLSADALPAFVQNGKAAALKHMKIEGDAEFARTLGYLAEHLRWEPEEDLARLIGDAQATRIASLARLAGNGMRTATRNLLDSLADYLLDENPQLVRHSQLDGFSAALAGARDALARVEQRIERLEQKVPSRVLRHPAASRTGS